ncbi:uncharacterized protein [Leptinotarsa decemlineata]|uniref:uncharacterized protein n=1 Tax=Leptinotarsa decemlineata TaxID=7539 RepID=UPI003D30AED9
MSAPSPLQLHPQQQGHLLRRAPRAPPWKKARNRLPPQESALMRVPPRREPQRSLKKLRSNRNVAAPTKTFVEAALRHLKEAIIDETNPYGKVTAERESLIKKQLLEELDKIIFSASSNNSKPPMFKSWTYSGEIIRVVCDDDVTLEWLKKATMNIKPWEEASLAVDSVDKLPKLTKASLWIPEDVHKTTSGEKERVLGRLKAQNPDLKVARWCTFHHEVKMNPQGHLFVFGIGDEDMVVLKKKSMRLSYAFTSLTIRATIKETESTSEDPKSSEVEPPKVDIDPKATMGPEKEVEASEQMTFDDLTEEAPKNSEATSPLAGEQMDL